MRNLSELHFSHIGPKGARPKPSNADYNLFEETYGVKFPLALRLLLEHSNGGHPELDSFLPEGRRPQERFNVNRFFRLLPNDESAGGFAYTMRHWGKLLGPYALPFASDGGGNIFFLDTSREPPPVMICLHDTHMATALIAPNFETFIDGLDIDPDMI